jgi:hypothetical protein
LGRRRAGVVGRNGNLERRGKRYQIKPRLILLMELEASYSASVIYSFRPVFEAENVLKYYDSTSEFNLKRAGALEVLAKYHCIAP